jgi:hypothetical protein
MAIEIRKIDDRNFLANGDPKSTSYRAFAEGDFIVVASEGASIENLFNAEYYKNIVTKDAAGTVLVDGSTGTVQDVIVSINSIVNFNSGSSEGTPIDSNYFFDDTAARDAYFIANPSELVDEVTVAVSTGVGLYYIVQEYDLGTTSWDDLFTGIRIGDTVSPEIIDNTAENFIPIKQSGAFESSDLSYNPTEDRYESAKTFYAPTLQSDASSIEVSDSVISSGGREISARSLSTGNRGAFTIQLFDDVSFKDAIVFDKDQTATDINIQTADDSVASGVRTNNFRQVVQSDVQFMAIKFKPDGGVIAQSFEFIIRINATDAPPSYKKLVELTDPNLTDLGGGLWELKLENPVMFDAGFDAYIETQGISLLGGNGFTGPVLFGDATNNDYFPYLISNSIPVVRNTIITDKVIPTTLADGETIRYNATNENYEGTGDTNTDTEVNFGTKDIVTDGIVRSGSGTQQLGDAYSIGSGGEQVVTKNLISGEKYVPVLSHYSTNEARERITVGIEQEIIAQTSKADIVINPVWTTNPAIDWRVVKFTFEVDTTIDNVELKIIKSGADFYTAKIGTLTANVETTIDLETTDGNVPIDAFFGDAYILSLSSPDGDVRCKGTNTGGIPWSKVGFYPFKDLVSSNENQSSFGKMDDNFTSYSSNTPQFVNYDSTDQVIVENITNETKNIAMLAIELSHSGNYNFVNMRVDAERGSFSQLVNLVNGLQTIAFDEVLIINANETFTITFDATNGVSGDGGATTQMSLGGVLAAPIDIYYVLKVRDIVTHTMLLSEDVPTKAIESFSNTDARFFGELGLPNTQTGWTTTATGIGNTITLVNDDVFGVPQNVVRYEIANNPGEVTSARPLSPQEWTNILNFGASYSGVSRLSYDINTQSIFAGMGFSADNDPRNGTNIRSRVGVYILENGTYTVIRLDGQTDIVLDGLEGRPKVLTDEWFSWEVFIEPTPDGGNNFGAATMRVNGLVIVVGGVVASNNAVDNVVEVQNSSGSGQTAFYFANFGVTIYEEGSTKTLLNASMNTDQIEVYMPGGTRDYTIILPDGNPRPIGSLLKIITGNVGGEILLRTENLAAPQALFNDLKELRLEVEEVQTISGVNEIDNANVYVGFGSLPTSIIENLSTGLIDGGRITINAINDNQIDIAAGHGRIVDFSDLAHPIYKVIEFPAQTVTGTRFGLTTVTHFMIDLDGNVVQTGTFDVQWPTAEERRQYIYVGNGDHNAAQDAFVSANNPQRSAYGLNGSLIADILESVGGIVSDGNKFSPNGANLKIDIESGVMIRYGGNFTDQNRPHTPDNETATQASFARSYQTNNGLSFVQFTDIDPDNYQPIGNTTTLEPVPAGKYTIQRFYRYGGGGPTGGGFNVVHYGNTAYQSLESARANILTEPFSEDTSLKPAAFKGWLIVKEGVTDQFLDYQGALRPPVYAVDSPLTEVDFVFAQLSDTTDQVLPAINTPYRTRFNTQDGLNNIKHDTVTKSYDVGINVSGSYSITAQPQVEKDGGGAGTQDFWMWLRKGQTNSGDVQLVTVDNPASILTVNNHNLTSGQIVYLDGFVTTPDINGEHIVTVTGPQTFTIPVITTAVVDGTGTFDRLLDSNDDVPNSTIRLAISDNFFSSVQILTATDFYGRGEKVNVMIEVTDLAVTLAADTPPGKPVVPSIIFTMNKVG